MSRGEGEGQPHAQTAARRQLAGEHSPDGCAFCRITANGSEVIDENEYAVAFYDSYPSSPGHTLFIPKRPVADYFQLTPREQQALQGLLVAQQERLDAGEPKPDGYNIGLNSNPAAGQTIGHAHLHLIPRYQGDVEDPRGGVRHVIPATARYWEDG